MYLCVFRGLNKVYLQLIQFAILSGTGESVIHSFTKWLNVTEIA